MSRSSNLRDEIMREFCIEYEHIGEPRYWAPADPGPVAFPTLVQALRFLVDLPLTLTPRPTPEHPE